MFLLVVLAIYVFLYMASLLEQTKQRRLMLGLRQSDMLLRVGISRQQYQRLESRGNPRLDTLELIAQGLNSELMLIPREKLGAVMALLAKEGDEVLKPADQENALANDPWQGLLGVDDD